MFLWHKIAGLLVLLLLANMVILSSFQPSPSRAQADTCPVNMMLVLNTSTDLDRAEWEAVQIFSQALPQQLLVADEDVDEIEYGLVQFAEDVEVFLPLTTLRQDDLSDLDDHPIFTTLATLEPTIAGADLNLALTTAQAEFPRMDNDYANILVVLADTDIAGEDAQATADEMRLNETQILSIVVGDIDLSEYVALSGKPENVITIGQYASLPVIMDILVNNICLAANDPSVPMVDLTETTPTPANSSTAGRATQLAFSSNRDGDSEIFVIHSDGTNLRQLTDNTADDDKPSFKKDGTQIAFESNMRGGRYAIYVIDLDGENLTQLTDEAYDSWGPSWSPDGAQIAFHSTKTGIIELYVMDADGGNIRQLTSNGNPIDRSAEWSPDGTQLVFYSDVTDGRELYIVDIELGEFERLTNNSYYDGQPDWSMNGTQIAFASTRSNSRPDIFLMQRDDLSVTRLTDDIATDDDPAWSPDGRQIAFESTRSGNYDIWIMDSDGTNLRQLTEDPSRDWSVDWAWVPEE